MPIIGGPLMLLGLVGFAIRVYQKVSSGHGLDTYFTGWGVRMNYIGALIVLILIPLVLVVAWLINKIIERREMQDFH